MNQNCHIIQDLLPLYVDDVLSEESKKFVEEHLKECEYCREMFNQMNHEFEVPSLQSDKGKGQRFRCTGVEGEHRPAQGQDRCDR